MSKLDIKLVLKYIILSTMLVITTYCAYTLFSGIYMHVSRLLIHDTRRHHTVSVVHRTPTDNLEQKIMIYSTCLNTETEAKKHQSTLQKLKIHSQVKKHNDCCFLALGPFTDYTSLTRQQHILKKLNINHTVNLRR